MASWVNFDTRVGWHERGYRVRVGAAAYGTNAAGDFLYHESDAEEKRVTTTMVSPREITQQWPTYKVSSQTAEGQDVVVRTIRAPNEAELFKLLRRLFGPLELGKMPMLEILRHNKDNTTSVILGDINKPWPSGVGIQNHSVILSAKPQQEGTASPSTERTNAIVSDLMALRNEHAARAREAMSESATVLPPPPASLATTQPTSTAMTTIKQHDDDELGRPTFCHKREVA